MLVKKFSIRKQEEMLKPELWQTLASRFINDSREDWGWGVKGGDGPRQEGFPVELCSSSLSTTDQGTARFHWCLRTDEELLQSHVYSTGSQGSECSFPLDDIISPFRSLSQTVSCLFSMTEVLAVTPLWTTFL